MYSFKEVTNWLASLRTFWYWERIALCGAHWTWKSTILNSFKANYFKYRKECREKNLQYEDYWFLTEVARDIIKELGKTPQEMNNSERLLFQYKILKKQIEEETELSKSHWNIIFDRGVFDILAYTETIEPLTIEDAELKIMIIETWTKFLEEVGYNKIFYFPIEFELEKDGIRFEDIEYQKKIDKIILRFIERFSWKWPSRCKVHKMTWNPEERFKTFSKELGFTFRKEKTKEQNQEKKEA